MVVWMISSVLRSTLAVASSQRRIFELLKIARAKQTSCFCPELRFPPNSAMGSCNVSNTARSCTSRRADQIASSSYWSKGSRFCLIVPENNHGDCGIMLIAFRKGCKPMSPMLTPSISRSDAVPSASIRRNIHWVSDDFPAPVRPTIATFERPSIDRLTSLRIRGRFFAYLAEKFLNCIDPTVGHEFGIFATSDGRSNGASGSKAMYSKILSIEIS
mmetsp:Transcript_21679/g.35010  ORF Transcript_21679/g.35010 Transcript_21679/m.35010 type:complete len:216 (-) Transcript_21679:81-728(-)